VRFSRSATFTRALAAVGSALYAWALPILLPSVGSAATYKCVAQDGGITFTDRPCPADAKTQSAVSAGPSSTRPLGSPPGPPSPDAAKDRSARETSALLCGTRQFNAWIASQSRPLPDPDVRRAKLLEIANQCRRSLQLPDIVDTTPRTQTKPMLSGPAGDAAARTLAELVRSGSIERLQRYLSSPGVDINDRPGTDTSLLDYAAEQNAATVTLYLLEHGARVYARQTHTGSANYGLTALHLAAMADAAEVTEALLTHAAVDAPGGADVDTLGPLGVTALILAASHGSRRTAEVLLNHGAKISVQTAHRETALSEATAHGHSDIVRLMLIHVPVPDAASMNAAAARGDVDALRLMLMHDDLMHDVAKATKDRALRYVIVGGSNLIEDRTQMIGLLLASGADINNRVDNAPNTPVMMTTTPTMLQYLIAHGADATVVTPYGTLPQAIACNRLIADPVGMLKVLQARGLDVASTVRMGMTPMECAISLHREELKAYLLAQGVPDEVTPQSSPAVADAQWVKLWEGDMALPVGGSAHVVEEADVRTHSHTGAIAHVWVRTSMSTQHIHFTAIDVDTFDCEHATYTIQNIHSAGPGSTISVKLAPELAMYQFACN
jgi:ankyrin repeat protein